ncbi:transposase [Nonomuraea fuscirosea]|uniref:transposase n=1 Tax=Nonomuraea fuscirosea TaxID=1291556 RepID=UPI000D06DFE6|nr:transposase [Nonomuraea fuscirosea]
MAEILVAGFLAGRGALAGAGPIITDTSGLLVTVAVLAASWRNPNGAKTALLSAYLTTPIRYVFADQGFAGRLVDWSRQTLRTTLEIVRKPTGQRGFSVISRRWVVERTLAWQTACRRSAREYERDPAVSEAVIRWAAIAGMARRLTRGRPAHHNRATSVTDTDQPSQTARSPCAARHRHHQRIPGLVHFVGPAGHCPLRAPPHKSRLPLIYA